LGEQELNAWRIGGSIKDIGLDGDPAGVGRKFAELHLSSNDADENLYDIVLKETGLSFTTDTDGDGKLEFKFALPGNAPFYRLLAE
jgi:hypothetical protein